MKFSTVMLASCIPIMVCGSAAHAEERRDAPQDAPPAIFQRLIDCRAIRDDAARLACYDTQIVAVTAARANRDLVVIDREQVRNTRRSLFGLSLPNLAIFGHGNGAEREADEFTQIDSTIRSASMRNYRWEIVLADGAKWDQVDTRSIARDPGPGMSIRIRRAAMGSFLANIDNQVAVRVRRVN